MLYALSNDNQKIKATHKGEAVCPFCKTIVRPKCGDINIHHWAHETLKECDTWSEGETDWHRGWKSFFPKNEVEVAIKKGEITHRADYCTTTHKFVVEFQYSSLAVHERFEREVFYRNMVWVVKVNKDADYCYISNKDNKSTIFWSHQIKWITKYSEFLVDLLEAGVSLNLMLPSPKPKVFLDFDSFGFWDEGGRFTRRDDLLFEIGYINQRTGRNFVYGNFLEKTEFVDTLLKRGMI